MRTSIALLATLAATALAAPAPFPKSPAPFNPLGLLSLIPKYVPAPPPGSCPVNNVSQPSSSLPSPQSGLNLALVALGRGTQNYTCATSDASTIPAAIGANATLFNASCIASHMSNDVLASMTQAFEKMDVSAIPLDIIGSHFFVDTTTPAFVINGMGTNIFKKSNSTNAPTNTNGDVAWLKLDAPANAASNVVKEVYRLNTQGGSQPANCAGQPPTFEVQYAADYYFYTG